MKPTLRIEPDPGPIERTRADVVVVTYFDSDRPLRGSAGRADWRLCGRLSWLIAEGKLAGGAGEAALVPSWGGLRAPLLLALGLGPAEGFDERRWRAAVAEAVARCLALDAATIGLPLVEAPAGGADLGRRVEALVAGAARAVAECPAEVSLRVVAPRRETAQAAKLLESTRPPALPPEVTLELPAREGRPAPAPGARPAASEANLSSTVK